MSKMIISGTPGRTGEAGGRSLASLDPPLPGGGRFQVTNERKIFCHY